MNSKLFFVATLVSAVLSVDPLQAHQPGNYGGSGSDISGSVTIWSGAPYGTGYSGTINYGKGYAPVPPYHGAYWYPACGHWHPKAYRAPKNHAYARGYARGYADSYYYGGHHGNNGHNKHGKKHNRGHGNGHHH